MDILSILQLLMNIGKQKAAESAGGANLFMDMASRVGGEGGYAQAATEFPKLAQQFQQTVGKLPQSPVMTAATGMEGTMDLTTPVQAMTQQQPSAFARMMGAEAKDVPLMKTDWPKYRPTPEQSAAIERIKASREEAQRAVAGDILGAFKGLVKPGATAGTTTNLEQSEAESAAKGQINPSWMPRAPQAATGGIDWSHDLDRKKVISSLAAVNNDPSKLTPELQALGVNYNLVKKVGTNWQLGNWQEAEKTIPSFRTPKEAITEGIKYAPSEHNTTPRATQGGYTWGYEAKPGAGQPISESYMHGLAEAAVYEYQPKADARIKANLKEIGMDQVNKIYQALRDPLTTAATKLNTMAPFLDEKDRADINKRMIGGARIGKSESKSSWEAWAESGKVAAPPSPKKEEIFEASHTQYTPPGQKKSRDARIRELSTATDPKTGLFKYNHNEIEALIRKEGY